MSVNILSLLKVSYLQYRCLQSAFNVIQKQCWCC